MSYHILEIFKALLRFVLKILKAAVISVLIFIALFILVMLIGRQYDYFKNKQQETIVFEEVKSDFDAVNSFILENFADSATFGVLKVKHDTKYTCMYVDDDEKIEVDRKLGKSLKAIDDMVYSISVTKERVEYEGFWRKYVYSRNGKKPKHFYADPSHGPTPHVYNLGDNWYLLTVNYR